MIYEHKLFLDKIVAVLKSNEDVFGVAATESYITE